MDLTESALRKWVREAEGDERPLSWVSRTLLGQTMIRR
jgi:hypothetical protein